MIGLMRPASICGQTALRTAATRRAFSTGDRGISRDPVITASLACTAEKSNSILAPLRRAMMASRPDVAVLARCIEANSEISSALQMNAATRRERASRIQVASSENDWLRTGSNADWVYGYDAWSVPLERDEQMPA